MSKSISETELRVMDVLWECEEPATVRAIAAEIYEDASFSKYQSVQKLLERLEKKGCVSRDRSGAAHTFVAAMDRDAILASHLEKLADSLCGGSLTPLLMHLAGRTRLKPGEREALQKLINSKKKR